MFSRLRRAFAWLWWLVDASRRTLLNLLFLLLLGLLAWLLLRNTAPQPLQDNTALVLALRGPVHEQFHGSMRENALKQLRGQPLQQARLRDVLTALDAAAQDPAITRAVLVLDDFAGAGLPTLREIAAAIERFKASGKSVVAWGSGFDQRQYYLAAHASEVWLHPMGAVLIEGFGGHRNYYKDALDKFGITAHVLRVGPYKNAAESFVASEPSAETLEADRLLYDTLWAAYTGGVERARKLPAGSISAAIEQLPERLAAVGGDLAKLALKEKLVDALKTRDQLRASLIEQGVRDGPSFRQIPYEAYLQRVKRPTGSEAVGVIVAEGAIVDGQAGGGAIGGLSTAELVRRARDDQAIKAIVLRVDSPGGSAFGSELVRRELELTRQAGKPVVVSMGDLAASGGYWIGLAADEVIADETTITGSIGVVALLPSAERALDQLGVRTGGHTTTWLVDAYDLRRGLDPRFAQVIQSSIDHIYADFTGRVATARKTTPDAINAVAGGRVWTGAQARERGLVDRNGSLADALAAAAQRAQLGDGHRVVYIEQQPGRTERLLSLLGAEIATALGPQPAGAGATGPLPLLQGAPAALWQTVHDDLSWLAGATASAAGKPVAAMAHCLCSPP